MTFWHYIIIGIIVQTVILIERAIRIPGMLDDIIESCISIRFWTMFIVMYIFSAITWPMSIYREVRSFQL